MTQTARTRTRRESGEARMARLIKRNEERAERLLRTQLTRLHLAQVRKSQVLTADGPGYVDRTEGGEVYVWLPGSARPSAYNILEVSA